jgi:hypothetical protein
MILDFGFWILDLQEAKYFVERKPLIQNPKSKIQNGERCLDFKTTIKHN